MRNLHYVVLNNANTAINDPWQSRFEEKCSGKQQFSRQKPEEFLPVQPVEEGAVAQAKKSTIWEKPGKIRDYKYGKVEKYLNCHDKAHVDSMIF